MGILVVILTLVFVIACILITLLVLIQPPHSDGGSGLAGAFIGAGGDSFFGTKAMTMAGKITIGLSILVIALAMTINRIGPAKKTKSIMEGTSKPAESSEPEKK
jgi:protein translocase SecG subunit